jgi:uncharacterized membrane protein
MELVRSLHAVAGIVLLLSGLIQIILPKGGMRHAMTGLTYLCAWLVVLVSSFFIADAIIISFGIFGFYMALTGWRFANRRRTTHKLIDKIIVYLGAASAVATLVMGMRLISQGHTFGWVGIVLGSIFCILTFRDLKDYVIKFRTKKSDGGKSDWYFEHFRRMYISYIAATTAFIVIQDLLHNTYMNWLIPVVIGFFLMVISKKFFRKKLTEQKT